MPLMALSVLARGFRTVYEKGAVAFELHLATAAGEFRRRVRISRGNFQQIALLLPVLGRKDLRALFVFVSHKALRAFQPFYLLGLLCSSVFQPGPLFRAFFLLQATFYLLGLLALALPRPGRLMALPLYFLSGNAAIILAFVRQFRTGKVPARLNWEKS